MSEELSFRNRKGSPRKSESGYMAEAEEAWNLDEAESEENNASFESDRVESSEPKNPGSDQANPMLAAMLENGDDEEEKPSALDIRRLLVGVWKRKLLVVATTILMTMIFVAIALFLVNKNWTSKSVLIKKAQIDQFQVGGGSYPYEPQNYSFETMLGTLKLPTVLQTAMNRSGIDVLPRVFASQIKLSRDKSSNLFSISVTWDEPQLATTLTNNLVTAFIDYNRAMRRDEAAEVYDYYAVKLDEVESKATILDKQIQEYRRENKVINFDRQTEAALRKIADLQVEYRAGAAELSEIKLTDANLEQLIADTPEMTIQTTLYRNPLKKKRSELEWSLQQIRGRYTDENPKVKDLLDQIASIDKVIAEGGDQDTPENVYAINPVRAELLMKQLENRDKISIKSALVTSLKQSLEEAQTELRDLTESQQAFTALFEERESMTDLLNNLRNRVEEAGIIMQSNQSDFEIVEMAELPLESDPSPRKLIAVAGVILGGGLGLFIALLLEFIDPRVRTRKEVIGLLNNDNVFEVQRLPESLDTRTDPLAPDSELASLMRRYLNNIESDPNISLPAVVSITGLDRQAGVSTLAFNLAVSSATKDINTLLIDGDLSNYAGDRSIPSQNQGLAECLSGNGTPRALSTECSDLNTLSFLSAGLPENLSRNAVLRLSSSRMQEILNAASKIRKRLIIDLPPVSKYESVFELIHILKSTVLVIRSGSTKKRDIKEFATRAEKAGINIAATFLIDVDKDYSTEQAQFTLKG